MAGQHAAHTEQSTTEGVERPPPLRVGASSPTRATATIPFGTTGEIGHPRRCRPGRRIGWADGLARLASPRFTQRADQGEEFLQVGRQGALNLTVFDYATRDAQVQRTLDLATGKFYADFQRRAPSFADIVKQVKSSPAERSPTLD